MPQWTDSGTGSSEAPAGLAPALPDVHVPASFIGRDYEVATVVEALAHPPAVVLVEGEPGIGKTRLVRECLTAPSLRELSVLEVVCPPLQEPFPLGPLVDALHCAVAGPTRLALSPLGGALRPQFPEWADELPPAPEPLDDPKSTQHRLLRALVELLERTGVELLLVEDAHWADLATLELLLLLVTARRPDLRLVLTYRPTDLSADSPLRRLTRRSSGRPWPLRVAPEPFSPGEVKQLVASMFASDRVSDEFVGFLHERTGGVPLALEESLWLLRDRGDIVRRDGRWTRDRAVDQLQVPPTVRDSVLERAHRLDRHARRVVEAAAVLAGPTDEAALARVAGLDERATRHGVTTALQSGLLHEAGAGRFMLRHGLASLAVEKSVPAPERRRLHGRAGRMLEHRDNASPARLSRHFQEAGDVARWSHYAEAAADRAFQSGDDRAAVVTLLELLGVDGSPPERRDRLARKLGHAATGGVAALSDLAGQVTGALHRVLAAEDARPGDDQGEVRVLLGRLLLQLGEFDEGYRQLEAALSDPDLPPTLAARAMMALGFPRGNGWPAARHLEWLHRGAQQLPHLSSDEDWTSLVVDRASALLFLGEQAGWLAVAEAGDASTLAQRRQVARLLLNAGNVAIAWGWYDHARDQLRAAESQVHATGYERLVNSVMLTMAYLDWQTGRWQGLAGRVAEADDGEGTLPEAHLQACLTLALLDLVAGHHEAAGRRLREVLADASRRGLVDMQMAPAAALGRLHLADDAAPAAVRATGPGIELLTQKDLWLWATDLAPVHVEALARTGDPGAARVVVERFATGLAGRDALAPAAALLTCQAMLAEAEGDPREAAARHARAAYVWSDLPRPYDELLAAERQGRALLAAGATEEGLTTLRTAQERLSRLGARWDADRVAHLLRRHGVEVSRSWRGGRRGYGKRLSPREREVARLVADGRTNRQVAELLFLSPRTVDHHLGAAMHKLGVSSRTALAVAVADRGLLSDGTDKEVPGHRRAGGASENGAHRLPDPRSGTEEIGDPHSR